MPSDMQEGKTEAGVNTAFEQAEHRLSLLEVPLGAGEEISVCINLSISPSLIKEKHSWPKSVISDISGACQ